MPGEGFLPLSLAETFEKTDRGAIRVQAIDVIEHDYFVAVLEQPAVHSECRGVGLYPTHLRPKNSPDIPALLKTRPAHNDEQTERACGELVEELVQFGVRSE
jgi:hypothetical protein